MFEEILLEMKLIILLLVFEIGIAVGVFIGFVLKDNKEPLNERRKMKHISFTKIPQFRNVVRNVNFQSQFEGLDENNEPILNKNKLKPTIIFHGTVKLHGTCGSVCMSDEGEMWIQSRKRILSAENDNYGFYQFCYNRKESFNKLFKQLPKNNVVCIFGEYCGEGINSGCAIHKLPKMFVIFAVKIVPVEGDSYYINSKDLRDTENQIYNINDFQTFLMGIDFNYPELAQNEFVKLVEEVEKECPVGEEFGVSGVGEGIVWVGEYEGQRHYIKTKGQKHSISNVKKIAPVDVEKVNSVREFVEYAVTKNRMNQAVIEIFEDQEPIIQKMGDYLRWIVNDIAKEELDVLKENNLILKDVGKAVSTKARIWFQELLDKNVGL